MRRKQNGFLELFWNVQLLELFKYISFANPLHSSEHHLSMKTTTSAVRCEDLLYSQSYTYWEYSHRTNN